MKLNELSNIPGSKKDRMRVGRGIGSGKGKTCGRGGKGQTARSGVTVKGEGGQMPLVRRLPKRGFVSVNKVVYQTINLGQLQRAIDEKWFDAKTEITKEVLKSVGMIGKLSEPVVLLADGDIRDKINIQINKASAAALDKVSKAGGKVEIIGAAA
ncbi:MAG: 50S ribosomal protein L15 [Alphaproteobacteria bacterium]|jgi:large subunit ribosomal protein L15|nr:50S ribosomal protein L15 [Alphaproteobacteria bacterium]